MYGLPKLPALLQARSSICAGLKHSNRVSQFPPILYARGLSAFNFPVRVGALATAHLVSADFCMGQQSVGLLACRTSPHAQPGVVPQTQKCEGKGKAPTGLSYKSIPGHPCRDGTSSQLCPPALPAPLCWRLRGVSVTTCLGKVHGK